MEIDSNLLASYRTLLSNTKDTLAHDQFNSLIGRMEIPPTKRLEKSYKSLFKAIDKYSHGDMEKKELIMQMDIMDISELDVKRIKKIIGNLAVVRFINNDLIIHYFPYFNNLRIQTIKEFNIENNYLFITLIEDLEKQKYKIWYDNQDVYNRILNIIVF